MPKYKCNKTVHAFKIKAIDDFKGGEQSPGGKMIVPKEEGYADFYVDGAYMEKHSPTVGGYYVVYEDGYKSFSPAEAFEGGYARVK